MLKKGHQGWQIMIFKSKQNPGAEERLLLLKKSPHVPPQPCNKRGHQTMLRQKMLSYQDHGQRWSMTTSSLLQWTKQSEGIAEVQRWSPHAACMSLPTLDRVLSFSGHMNQSLLDIIARALCQWCPSAWSLGLSIYSAPSPQPTPYHSFFQKPLSL